MERAMFEQCPYLCDAEENKAVGKRPSGCDLPSWHRPVTMQAYAVDGKYTYTDGHRFTCSHASSEIFRHILVLDCSGSMKGGTFYAKGLRESLALISRTDTKTYRPVVIFFTDGRPVDRNLRKYASVGPRFFVVGFGKVSDFGLEDLASALGGKVHEACSMNMLTETFRSISMLLRCVVRTSMGKERTSQPLKMKTSMLIENVAGCA
ncbi:hypothetical protein PsorP6_016904 [Peronosclerospora sorghi]|uniref:Uncharacterized protein n=1 Tax=Peronosclerospora sorghi TaxID=230839 RepID=A0ACC0WFB6_9STRA|nr:hypothetical protein PsorP6_016904 [Peronosclerospora sorghi]